MTLHTTLSSIALALLISTAGAPFSDAALAGDAPATIRFSTDLAYPESATWSAAQHTFFVSSVHRGTVARVGMDGSYVPFITDPRLVSAIGVLADDAHGTLWVANADSGVADRSNASTAGKMAAVAAYDEKTGAARGYWDLSKLSPGAHFANDMILDASGNLYVTDSFAPVIYKIAADGSASIFATSPLFHSGDGFNLNGITLLPDGQLLVGKYNSGDLYRVSLADPSRIAQVKLPAPLPGADGFNLLDATHLVLAQSLGNDETVELVSSDDWASAQVLRTEKSLASMPSAIARAGSDVYTLNSRIDTLFDPKAAKVGDYLLQKF